jgi:hypothetical protein
VPTINLSASIQAAIYGWRKRYGSLEVPMFVGCSSGQREVMKLIFFDEAKDDDAYPHYHIGAVCIDETALNGVDLSAYALENNLDGFVIEGRTYLLRASRSYQAYLRMPNLLAVESRKDSTFASNRFVATRSAPGSSTVS